MNEWMNEEKALAYSIMTINVEGKMDLEKASFGNHHINNWFRQGLQDTKTKVWYLMKIGYTVSKYFPHKILTNYDGGKSLYSEKPADSILFQWSKLISK